MLRSNPLVAQTGFEPATLIRAPLFLPGFPQTVILSHNLVAIVALPGSCTTVVEMLAPGTEMMEEAKHFVKLYESNAYIDLGLSARIFSRHDLKHIQAMADYGVAGFKLLLLTKDLQLYGRDRERGSRLGVFGIPESVRI